MAGAVEMGVVEIHGLREAALLLDSHGADHVDAVVASVQIRQAPALLQLLETATTTEGAHWDFKHNQKLRHLSRITCELDLLLDVAVPLLKSDPKSPAAGRMLNKYAWSLRRLARKVDGLEGTFFEDAVEESNFLHRHALHLHKGTRGRPWLVNNLIEVEKRLLYLKRTIVMIPKVEGVDDAEDEDAEGDGDDVDEEEAGGK